MSKLKEAAKAWKQNKLKKRGKNWKYRPAPVELAYEDGGLYIIEEAQLRVDECRNRGIVITDCQTAQQLLEFLESLTEEQNK